MMSNVTSRISSLEDQVSKLTALVYRQYARINELEEKLASKDKQLEEALVELRRLKKLPKKPKIKPSELDKPKSDSSKGGGKRAGSEKRRRRVN